MTPTHHIPEQMLFAYAAGTLAEPFAATFACHLSQCDDCRARLETHQSIGGILLETLPETSVSADLAPRVMAALDHDFAPPGPQGHGVYPAPLAAYFGPQGPKWRALGGGVKQSILVSNAKGSLRLLSIPAGRAVPEHGHNGQELTLVLQGGFSDQTGSYGVGDLEVADQSVDHVPIAWPGADCICLAATDAPLRFRGMLPRLLQPLFRI
jgi:putative transcriptional regulator